MKVPQKIIAALFDLDGVVIDTENQYTDFWVKTCEQYKLGSDAARQLKGQTLQKIFEMYFLGKEEIQRKIIDSLTTFEANMSMNYIAGFPEFIRDLRIHNVKLAIVTSSNKQKMNSVYTKHPEFQTTFDTILTAEQFPKSKPEPDCYLLGANYFNIAPENCFVFEDSFNGLKAGRAAGMKVIGLSTTNSAESIRNLSDIIIPDFTGMTYEKLIDIFR